MNPEASLLPVDSQNAHLVGRVVDPADGGPSVVAIRGHEVVDLTAIAPTVADLLERRDRLDVVQRAAGRRRWQFADVVRGTKNAQGARFLAPIDLHAIKAAGVTFARSMVERVIEEQAAGDARAAASIRERVNTKIGAALGTIVPGSIQAAQLKEALIDEGLWSQYLEVGIGPDPEIFTKAPVLSAVGPGAPIGVLGRSTWNNPEPELVLAVTSDGTAVGATLGNDVNLRDFEGRSALLLTEAKDNNASCAIGPFIRLFDDHFTIDSARQLVVSLNVRGDDGFALDDTSSVGEMSRSFEDLISHAIGRHHQYPDGLVLFTGTMFAPTKDRGEPGKGFTHKRGDVVRISAPELGILENVVIPSEEAAEWTFGIRALYANLHERGLMTTRPEAGQMSGEAE
ncbi:fumarylacetoacetate hydrolase family protein [Microbacterium sp. MPKO10]|uniref:fumarylacetoacetate hydrolase family protein n=1 Tax=Microbacterium sp. MPKO10 TaxID=2989818 RepID=UPI002236B7EC|nr:fumarylacetoacetate hydrolase family protein [Microbacterium sp. MPKO10]MCW4458657.1 fumarylacetoacetate hydrolase family protein [Microbacterium sp. MPKO10]